MFSFAVVCPLPRSLPRDVFERETTKQVIRTTAFETTFLDVSDETV